MSTIKLVEINKGFAILIVFFFMSTILGCGSKKTYSNKDLITFNLLDVFIDLPNIDSTGRFLDIASLYFTFEIQNNSNDNHCFTFDNWTRTNKNSIRFYFLTNCVNSNDSMKVNLAYVTSPDLFIESKSIDTVVLKTDFRELEKYFNECTTTDKKQIAEALKCIYIQYESFKAPKIIYENRKKIIPVVYLGQTVCQRIDSQ